MEWLLSVLALNRHFIYKENAYWKTNSQVQIPFFYEQCDQRRCVDLQAIKMDRLQHVGWRVAAKAPVSLSCVPPPLPSPQGRRSVAPWTTLNQHRSNEVSHLTPSSLGLSHGCQSHNELLSISSACLTQFDSWESLGPVRSKLPLSKCHHRHIHQPHLPKSTLFLVRENKPSLKPTILCSPTLTDKDVLLQCNAYNPDPTLLSCTCMYKSE